MTSSDRTAAGVAAQMARAAARHPDVEVAICDRRGRAWESRSHPAVVAAARAAAERLAGLGVAPGDRVVVSLPTSWEFVDAWLGALFLGALPVASPAGVGLGASEAQRRRLEETVERLGAARLVARGATVERLRAADASHAARVAVTPTELAAASAVRVVEPRPEPDEPAFLQLTSGSTGRQRAVMVPQRAVLHQAMAQDEIAGAPLGAPLHRVATFVSWLPLYHDMGLLGLLSGVLASFPCRFMPPEAFLGRPTLWLRELAGTGATATTAPNFGYQNCVERVPARALESLDLAGFRVALTGAEMIRPDTVEAFSDRFGRCGFERRSFRPCYGLAEAALAVTMDRDGAGPRTVPPPRGAQGGLGLDRLVSCGPPFPGTELRIEGPDGRALPEGEVGEVLVRGPSVFVGYWDDPGATAETLRDGWLRTGDLGFVDRGELVIAGRIKELIIFHGQNLMPHEIERLAEGVGGGRGGRAAAFSVARDAAGEQIVVAVEVADPGDAVGALADEVRSRIGRELGLPVADVPLVRRGRIPRTTSGKIRRGELRRRYLERRLERLV